MDGFSTIYYINSADRLAGTTENFTYELNIPSGSSYDSVSVIQANIPVSYYLVQSGFNTFTLQEGVTSVTVTIPVGNYSASSFATVVPPLLNSASPNHWTYIMTLPNSFTQVSTGKYTFTVSGNSSQPSFIFTDNVNELFGFRANSTATFVGNQLTSENVLKFILEDTLLLHSDICDNGDNSILQEIFSNNSQSFSNITFQNPDIECYSRRLRTNESSVYSFSITNEYGRGINLNGLNVVFTIVLFRRQNFTDIFKKYIKYQLTNEK